ERRHHVGIGVYPCSRCDTKKASLGINGVQVSVCADVHPGDIVADGPDFVTLLFERRDQHGEVCLAAGARKGSSHIGDLATGPFKAEAEHVFGHPSLRARHVARNAESETLLAEEGVATVAGPDAPDQALFGEVSDVTAHGIKVAE